MLPESPRPALHEHRSRPAALRRRRSSATRCRAVRSRWTRRRARCSRCTARRASTPTGSSAACRRSTTRAARRSAASAVQQGDAGAVSAGLDVQARDRRSWVSRPGIVGLDDRMPTPCTGGMQFGNRYFRCWEKKGHGSLNLRQAIAKSCDVYFYQLGLRLGHRSAARRRRRARHARARAGIDLPDEKQAAVAGRARRTSTSSYGQRNWSNRRGAEPGDRSGRELADGR